jgi:four helix bundle protein
LCNIVDVGSGEDLKVRTKQFALRVIRVYRGLPSSDEARVIGRQLLRSATSVGANYRAACRARSRAEFIAKLGIVLEEADEAVFWLELLLETGILDRKRLEPLLREANELTSIFVSSLRTAKSA